MKYKLIAIVLTSLSLEVVAQSITVNLPPKYTAEDLIKVDVTDSGHIYATYKVGEYEQKKKLCSTIDRIGGYGVYPSKKDPLYKVCVAAEQSVIQAMEKAK
ncbi:hypothetical protein [Pseudoalteromonas spongiae]|uniref:hypothetical protein n=1 Tax=Pseudoalteromonas spongiae TaxID=298657 RepID=UPI0012FD9344|nr:hypothetical protein [Pseudoalteromonas spongiae]